MKMTRWERSVVVTVVVVSVTGLVFAVTGSAVPGCTKTGTPQRDVMAGTPDRDVLCARGGGDYVSGGQGSDVLKGDGGRDTLVGGRGADRLRGMAGRDRLFAVDGASSDRVDGGSGFDTCHGDQTDRFRGCERTFRGPSLQGTNALSNAFNGQGLLAEDLISQATSTPTMVPPATVTVTVTRTASFPPCSPPPNQAPAPC